MIVEYVFYFIMAGGLRLMYHFDTYQQCDVIRQAIAERMRQPGSEITEVSECYPQLRSIP